MLQPQRDVYKQSCSILIFRFLNILLYWKIIETKENYNQKIKLNGEYKYIGRQKRNFVSGIENIYPEEIENLLLELPEVREVVVTPIPDEMVQFIPRYHISLYDKNIDYDTFENEDKDQVLKDIHDQLGFLFH